jgi:arylsulfatase A-like enzyme/Tfp pilus assembly protein PilF
VRLAATVLAAAAALAAPGCGRPEPAARPLSLLLVTIDTVRADRLGCYGYSRARTPNLDSLAADGVLFENAIAPAPVTLPSHASLLTGFHPAAHRLHTNGAGRLDPAFQTLAEALQARMRRSGAVVGSVVLDARFGLDQGFQDYDDQMPPAPPGNYLFKRERDARTVAGAAVSWLRQHAGEPFFLWVHFYDPHAPYTPPAPWNKMADPYDGEIASVDEALGQLLEALRASPAAGGTLVVAVGDHGEDLGQHGEATHGVFLYDSTLRVPLVFHFPAALPRGRRVAGIVRLVDLAPTLLDLFSLPPPAGAQGVSIQPLLFGEQQDLALEAFSESRLPEVQYGWAPLASLRQRDWLYVRAPEEELYAVPSDPDQRLNLAAREPARAAGLRERLESAREQAQAGGSAGAPAASVSEEVRRQIESLGYVGGGASAAPGKARSRVDPKRRVGLLASLTEAGERLSAGRAAEAEPALRAVLASDPENPFALRLQARALAMLGREREARRSYEQLIATAGEDAEILNGLGAMDLKAGRLAEAGRRFRQALDLHPGDARAANNLAFVVAREGNTKEAIRLLEGVLEMDPLSLDTVLNLALLRESMGQADEAEAVLRRALGQAAGEASLSLSLAGLLERRGRSPEAAAVYRGLLVAGRPSSRQRTQALSALERLRGQ